MNNVLAVSQSHCDVPQPVLVDGLWRFNNSPVNTPSSWHVVGRLPADYNIWGAFFPDSQHFAVSYELPATANRGTAFQMMIFGNQRGSGSFTTPLYVPNAALQQAIQQGVQFNFGEAPHHAFWMTFFSDYTNNVTTVTTVTFTPGQSQWHTVSAPTLPAPDRNAQHLTFFDLAGNAGTGWGIENDSYKQTLVYRLTSHRWRLVHDFPYYANDTYAGGNIVTPGPCYSLYIQPVGQQLVWQLWPDGHLQRVIIPRFAMSVINIADQSIVWDQGAFYTMTNQPSQIWA